MRLFTFITDMVERFENGLDNSELLLRYRKGFCLSRLYTMGDHLYRREFEQVSVRFVDMRKGIFKVIIDNNGRIKNFPGIRKEDIWIKFITSREIEPVVRYGADFELLANGNYIMRWVAQPDGRYWEDEDGFGAEPDEEVVLYTCIDQKGRFTGPFRIYSVGMKYFIEKGEIEE